MKTPMVAALHQGSLSRQSDDEFDRLQGDPGPGHLLRYLPELASCADEAPRWPCPRGALLFRNCPDSPRKAYQIALGTAVRHPRSLMYVPVPRAGRICHPSPTTEVRMKSTNRSLAMALALSFGVFGVACSPEGSDNNNGGGTSERVEKVALAAAPVARRLHGRQQFHGRVDRRVVLDRRQRRFDGRLRRLRRLAARPAVSVARRVAPAAPPVARVAGGTGGSGGSTGGSGGSSGAPTPARLTAAADGSRRRNRGVHDHHRPHPSPQGRAGLLQPEASNSAATSHRRWTGPRLRQARRAWCSQRTICRTTRLIRSSATSRRT